MDSNEYRKPHTITRGKTTPFPTNIISVAVATREQEDVFAPGNRLEVLSGWAACRHGPMVSVIDDTSSVCGLVADGFWKWAYNGMLSSHVTHLIGHDVIRSMTTLGLWHEIENGKVSLVSPDTRYQHERGDWYTLDAGKPGAVVLDDPPIIIELWRKRRKLVIIDLLNYTRCTPPGGPDPTNQAREVLELYRRWLDAWERERLGNWSLTASSLAWESWRHVESPHRVHIHGDGLATALERASVYGGICEARRVGPITEKVYGLDVRSFYPSIMSRLEVPTKLMLTGEGDIFTHYDERELYKCVAECRVVLPCGIQLPVRQGGVTWYASGNYWTVLAGPELQWASENGYVAEIARWSGYLCEPIFTRWVDRVLSLRADAESRGDMASIMLAKLVANGLYGKWAQRSPTWTVDHFPPEHDRWSQWSHFDSIDTPPVTYRDVGGVTWRRTDRGEWAHSFPAITAWIASEGRLHLRHLICEAGERHVLYCDTDSLLVDQIGYDNLCCTGYYIGDEHGLLKVVGEWDSGEIYGLKHYRLGDDLTCGGLADTARQTEHHEYAQRVRSRAASILDGGPKDAVSTWTQVFREDLSHPRGTIGQDGWVIPRHIVDCVRPEINPVTK